MPLLEFVMTHDQQDDVAEFPSIKAPETLEKKSKTIEDVHFNYYPNEKEQFNFSKYPTASLDGVAE